MEHRRTTFLGKKEMSNAQPNFARVQRAKIHHWIGFFCLSLIFGGVIAFANPINAATPTTPPPVGSCDNSHVKDGLNGAIFPLIPDAIVDYGFYDSPQTDNNGGCVPSLWNMTIFGMLIYKVLALLNYLAGALAILATLYAGILYLTGAMSEANVKKAKTALIGTYVGFFIVLGARLIVQSSFQLFGSDCTNISLVISSNGTTQCSTTP